MVPHPQGQNWHSVTGVRNTHTTTTHSKEGAKERISPIWCLGKTLRRGVGARGEEHLVVGEDVRKPLGQWLANCGS